MTHLIIKLIVYPFILWLSNLLLPNVHFQNIGQIFFIGCILSIIAYLADVVLVEEYGNTMQTLLDFIIAFLVILIFSYIFSDSSTTTGGAIITSLIFVPIEYFTHRLLLHAEKGYNRS